MNKPNERFMSVATILEDDGVLIVIRTVSLSDPKDVSFVLPEKFSNHDDAADYLVSIAERIRKQGP